MEKENKKIKIDADAFVDGVMNVIKTSFSEQKPEDQTKAQDKPKSPESDNKQTKTNFEIAQEAGLPVSMSAVVGNWISLTDGWFIVEADGSRFRVENGTIVEIATKKDDDSTSTSTDAADAGTDSTTEFKAEFTKFSEQFTAMNSKIELIESTLKAIGNLPAAKPVQRTESMSESKDKTQLRKYFKTDAEYKSYLTMLENQK